MIWVRGHAAIALNLVIVCFFHGRDDLQIHNLIQFNLIQYFNYTSHLVADSAFKMMYTEL